MTKIVLAFILVLTYCIVLYSLPIFEVNRDIGLVLLVVIYLSSCILFTTGVVEVSRENRC